jgi:transcriptional regulator with XRE-family HTH domain
MSDVKKRVKKGKPFRYLRAKLSLEDVSQYELAEKINLSAPMLSKKLMGESVFTIAEVYSICDVLDISDKDINKYFPKTDVLHMLKTC